MNQEEKFQTEDEVDLMDYVEVLLRRKWLISAVFLGAAIGAGVFSFVSPKIYKIDTILETPKEEQGQLAEKVKEDTYGIAIREKLGISVKDYPRIKAEGLIGANLVIIKIESPQPPKAKNVLEELNNFIVAESQERIKLQKETIQNDITITVSSIKLIERDIEITKNDIIRAEEEIKRVENKINYAEEEKKNLEDKIEALEKVLIYEQTPGTQFALFSTKEKLAEKKQDIEDLYSKVSSQRGEKENLGAKIKSLERDIENSNIQINFVKSSLEELKPVKIVKRPSISESPIKPRPLLNIVIAGALGIFLGLFLAFSKEWWEKSKIKN